ncbi:MAG: hypothetical protein ABJF50_02920 [Paracoccaceae bacterium]
MTHVPLAPVIRGAGNPLYELSITLGARIEQLRKRRSLKRLLDYEDYALNDMGMLRQDLDWVLSLPLSIDATVELKRLSDERHKHRLKP